MKKIFFLLFLFVSVKGMSQSKIDSLSVDLIMRDSKWIGSSPSSPYWSRDGWELAVYPVEDHAFTEPSSWTDEYKRILNFLR